MATKTYKLKRKISATESEEIKIPASSVDGLSTVATSGSYNDLSNKPTIPSVPTNYVTTDTAQDITGNKTVSSPQTIIDTNLIIRHDSGSSKNISIVSSGQGATIFQIENDQVYYDPDGNGFPLNVQGANAGTDGQVLTSRGADSSPEWANVPKTEVVQATGTSTTSVMSQKATTDELTKKANLNGGNDFTGGGQDFILPNDATFFISDAYDTTLVSVNKDGFQIDDEGTGTIPILLHRNAGTSGQVLTSQGAGKTPVWANIGGDMPTIRLVSVKDTTGTGICGPNNSLRFSFVVESGTLLDTDCVELCSRRLFTYKKGHYLNYSGGVQDFGRTYKLRAFHQVAVSNLINDQGFYKFEIGGTDSNYALREFVRSNMPTPISKSPYSITKYIRIRRVDPNRNVRRYIHSNVIPIYVAPTKPILDANTSMWSAKIRIR